MAVDGFLFVAVVAVLVVAFSVAFPAVAGNVFGVMRVGKSILFAVIAVLIALFAIQSGSLGLILLGMAGIAYLVLWVRFGGFDDLMEQGAEW